MFATMLVPPHTPSPMRGGYCLSVMKHMAGLIVTLISAALLLGLTGCRERAATAQSGRNGAGGPQPVARRVVGGLQQPVALAFLSPNAMLVAERRTGRILWIERGRVQQKPFATVPLPTVSGYSEFGLLDLAVDPEYPTQPYVYVFHTARNANNQPDRQRIIRYTVRNNVGTGAKVVVDNLPVSNRCCHNGGRMLFAPDGYLYVTIGDTQRPELAQNYESLAGKVLRYYRDGTIPEDNPFTIRKQPTGPRPEDAPIEEEPSPVYTIGHRNPFGIAANPDTGDIYITDNGPDANDEINRLVEGDNYGWPTVMGRSNDPRFRSPVWASGQSVIAPTGAVFYSGNDFPQYEGSLLFANYNDGKLRRAVLTGPDAVRTVEVITAAGSNARLDVELSPDGKLYFSSNNAVYVLEPRQ